MPARLAKLLSAGRAAKARLRASSATAFKWTDKSCHPTRELEFGRASGAECAQKELGGISEPYYNPKVSRKDEKPFQTKPAAERLGLPMAIDIRNFGTVPASPMRRYGVRLEIARDNMGHAGSTGSIAVDVYSKT